MRVVIVGANGQLGSDLMRVMDEAIPLTHSEIEVEDRASCERIVELEPDRRLSTVEFFLQLFEVLSATG
jgi:dTDP-4-dehydrorhamnose reductase